MEHEFNGRVQLVSPVQKECKCQRGSFEKKPLSISSLAAQSIANRHPIQVDAPVQITESEVVPVNLSTNPTLRNEFSVLPSKGKNQKFEPMDYHRGSHRKVASLKKGNFIQPQPVKHTGNPCGWMAAKTRRHRAVDGSHCLQAHWSSCCKFEPGRISATTATWNLSRLGIALLQALRPERLQKVAQSLAERLE